MPIYMKLEYLFREMKRDFRMVKTGKSVLSLNLGEGDYCSGETKHDRGTALRLKLFRHGDYRKKGHNPDILSRVRIRMEMFQVIRN
jgi:hypothetical protein